VVQGSIDGTTWTIIDGRENDEMKGDNPVVRTFSVSTIRECRFVKFVNVGANHRRDDALAIGAFELFGLLLE
jgi:hypothetical protein